MVEVPSIAKDKKHHPRVITLGGDHVRSAAVSTADRADHLAPAHALDRLRLRPDLGDPLRQPSRHLEADGVWWQPERGVADQPRYVDATDLTHAHRYLLALGSQRGSRGQRHLDPVRVVSAPIR